jgi:hypothetical protein
VVISSSSNFGHKCVQPSDANTFFTADMTTMYEVSGHHNIASGNKQGRKESGLTCLPA